MRKQLFCTVGFFISAIMSSQGLGIGTLDNFNGVYGSLHNPANSADTRTKWDVHLFSSGGTLATDYTTLDLNSLTKVFGENGFTDVVRFPSDRNTVFLEGEVLGPSVQFALDEKSGMALLTRVRAASTINNVNGQLFEGVYDAFSSGSFTFGHENLDFTTHFWAEVGLAYSRVLFLGKRSLLKAGLTAKYLIGGGAVQATSRTLSGAYDGSSEQASLTGDFSYAVSYGDVEDVPDYFNELHTGLGADLGVVYEWRTTKSLAAANGNNTRAYNKYKLKVGLSVLDIGAIRYPDTQRSEYVLDHDFDGQALSSDFIGALEQEITPATTVGPQAWRLPTSLHFNVDYSLTHKWYPNFNWSQGLVKTTEFFNTNPFNAVSLSPRFETRVFGASLPLSYSPVGKTTLGLGIRLGPLTLGSGSLFSTLFGRAPRMTNVFLGLHFPVHHKRDPKNRQ